MVDNSETAYLDASALPAELNSAAQARRKRQARLDRILDVLLPIIALAIIFAFWQWYVTWRSIPTFIFPTFTDTLSSLRDNAGDIFTALGQTLEEAGLGFVIGNVLAVLGATLFVHSRMAERALFPGAVIVQTIPIVVWAPILVIIFPTDSIGPQISIAVLISFFPALVNMSRGLRDVDPLLLELLRVLNAGWWKIYWKLRWPAAIPALFSTLRVTSTLSLVGAIVGEYVAGGGGGIGYAIITAKQSIDTPKVMAITLVASVTGIVIFLVVAALERIVLSRRGQV